MKIILGADPLLMPLTGIGHYTRNLALELKKNPGITSLEFFAHGKFFSDSLLNSSINVDRNVANETLFRRIRSNLARSEYAMKCYQMIIPYFERVALKGRENAIFHSPNFLLPNFDGKSVVTIHDLSTIKYPHYHPKARVEFVNRAIRRAVNKAEHIITDSLIIKQELEELYPGIGERVSAIPLAARPIFHPRDAAQCGPLLKKYGLEYGEYYFFISTLEPRKNISNLLKAYQEYRKINPLGKPLIFAGGKGWEDNELNSILAPLVKLGQVRMLGYVMDEELAIILSGARALFFPSFYEGFGLPALEAMQSGVPVLTSRNTSMHEVTGEYAALVDPNLVSSILDGIMLLESNDQLLQQNTDRALQRAQKFSWHRTAEQTAAIYRTI